MFHFTSKVWCRAIATAKGWRRVALTAVGVAALIVSVAISSALAADVPSTLQISVVDDKNQPVAEAQISVKRADAAIAKGATDASGKAEVALPAKGSYLVTIEKKGYLTTEAALEVTSSQAASSIDVVLSAVNLSQQSVNVKGTADNPVTDDSGIQQTLPTAQAKVSPMRPVTLTDALPLIPGIVRGQDGTVRIAGMGEDHSALLVNSVDVTDPATGNFGLSIPIDSIQTVEVSVMPYLAQYGRFTAGVVSAETRRGGDK